MFKVW